MPAVYAVHNAFDSIRPAASGTVMSVYTIAVVGDSREDLRDHPLQLISWHKHQRTHTYDTRGILVESPAPPSVDMRF